MMSLDEAIIHAEEVAEENEKRAEYSSGRIENGMGIFYENEANKCLECAKEHRQLAEWLKELKQKRQAIEYIKTEIIKYRNDHDEWSYYHVGRVDGLDDALEIVDKYISGKE